jgi:ABC-type antimicrobial peptide transport system permease subunit
LGATSLQILLLVTRKALRWTIIGLVLGLGGATLISHALSGLIYGLSLREPTAYLVVSVVLLGCTYAASLIPACRAYGTDPAAALRDH